MRGARWTEDGLQLVSTDPVANGGVRVSVTSSGICGTDLHLATFGPSMVNLGHEFSGTLDDGTPVAILPVVHCGQCQFCLGGLEQHCTTAISSMYGVSLDGGMADEVWVDRSCAKPVPADILEHACLVEPLAVALHGINLVGVESGARVVVIGAGPIGLCTIVAARSLGADVDLFARHTRRLEAGERLGASTSLLDSYDIVFDAAGTQSSMEKALELLRPGGSIALLGTFWEPVSLGSLFQFKEARLIPAFTYGHHHGVGEFEHSVEMLAANPELPETIITHHFSLDDVAEAYRVAGDRTADAIKVVVHP
jgi:2-desacetyl-2-hydroxyethyl bacteriochlorophyllide A dehydrogenase